MTRPATLDDLKQRIQEEVYSIPTEMLQEAMVEPRRQGVRMHI